MIRNHVNQSALAPRSLVRHSNSAPGSFAARGFSIPMKTNRYSFAAIFTALVIFCAWTSFAQATNNVAPADASQQIGTGFESVIIQLAQNHPWVVGLIALIGALRLFIKPLMTGIRYYVHSTASDADDVFLDKVEHSFLFTAFLFALDWITSIKLPAKSADEPLNKSLKILLLCSLLSALCFAGTGCAGRTTAQVVRALSADPASLHVRITSIYGTIEVARTAPRTNSMPHSIGADGTINAGK